MAKASDNLFPSLLLAPGAAPASPADGSVRVYVDSADGKMKRKASDGTVTTIEGGSGGSGFTPKVKWLRYTAGNLRVPATTTFAPLLDASGASIGTGLDLTLASGSVAVGDTIEVGAHLGYANEAQDPYISFGSVVAGTVTNLFDPTLAMAVPGLWATNGAFTNASGSAFYVVKSTDLSSGALTVRPLGKTIAGTGFRTIMGGGGNSAVFFLRNWGPQ